MDGEILVKFKPGTPETKKDETHQRKGGRVKENLRKRNSRVAPDVQVVRVDGDEETEAEDYDNDARVEYAEPNFIYQPSVTSTDPSFGKLYGLHNTSQRINNVAGTADADIDAPEAWDATSGLPDTLVAVIDTGVDTRHPDLDGNTWTNTDEIAGNGFDDDGNGYVDDDKGWDFFHNDRTVYDAADGDNHGTHVAGTIAAEGNNGTGVVGVNWKAQIIPLKFLGPNGGSSANAIRAIDYAVAKGAKISNNSWGGGSFSRSLKDTLSRADAAGHLFVAAAGNDGSNNDSSAHYPSSYDNLNVVSVAATDNKDALASFSNRGATSVDLAAPGVSIYSTLPNNSYGSYSGTSMAMPHVTGVAALIKSKNPTLDDAGVKDALLQSVDKKGNLAGKMATGGRLNANEALVDTSSPSASYETLNTSITSGPSGASNPTSASFEFSPAGVAFECKLDDEPDFSACDSGVSYSGLSRGSHKFEVRAKDAAGNTDPTPARRAWTVDATAPTVSSVSPADGAKRVPRTASVKATFSEAMKPETLTASTVTLVKTGTTTPIPATVSYDAASQTVTLKPSSRLALTKYTVMVKGGTGGATDQADIPLGADKTWSFTTKISTKR